MDVKVKATRRGVLIPEELFRELMSAYVKMEHVLATLETLADEEALKTIEKRWLRASTWNARWTIWREF